MRFRFALVTTLATGTLLGLGLARHAPPREQTAALVAGGGAVPAGTAATPVRWDLPVVWNESVARFVGILGHQQTDRMALYLKRSGRYEGMIRGKLRASGMPEDLIYLSMIESGFNPNARSKAHAVGLWQFVAETARRYGLRVDGYVDERRDPERSTDAALRYLNDLYEQFGAWNLAAAAYNTGENRVARIMREETGSVRGEEADFWRIRTRLPADTREYVPLIFAAALVGKEPARYGLEGVARWLPVETDTTLVPGGTDLGTVARALGVPRDDLQRLNPQLVQGVTPPGAPYPVRVPGGPAPLLNVQLTPQLQLGAGEQRVPTLWATRHRVRKGESLASVAAQHGVSVEALQQANALGWRVGLRPGQLLRIPG